MSMNATQISSIVNRLSAKALEVGKVSMHRSSTTVTTQHVITYVLNRKVAGQLYRGMSFFNDGIYISYRCEFSNGDVLLIKLTRKSDTETYLTAFVLRDRRYRSKLAAMAACAVGNAE